MPLLTGTHWVSCRELAALHQAVKGGFEDHVFSWDFFLLHPLCRQLLEKLSKTRTQGADTFAVCVTVESLDNSPLSHTNLNAGLLRGSGRDLGMIVMLRGLHWESHHRSCDGGWWSVIIRDLHTHNSDDQSV